MRLFILLIAGGLAASSLAAQTPQESDGPLIWAKAAGPTTSIRISHEAPTGGSLRVVGWDRDSVVFRGRAPTGVPFFGGDAENMKLGIWFGGTDPGANRGSDRGSGKTRVPVTKILSEYPLEMVVYVPKHSQLIVRSMAASINASDVSGTFYSVSGTIQLRGVSSTLEVESVSGSIDADVTASWMRARTGQGRLLIRGAIQDVDGSTVDGALDVASPTILRGRFSSVNGDIRYAGAPARGALFEFSNHGGTVDFFLPRSVSSKFELSSVTGPIENGFAQVSPVSEGPHALRLNLGGGNAQVTVRTFKGPIRLRQQP